MTPNRVIEEAPLGAAADPAVQPRSEVTGPGRRLGLGLIVAFLVVIVVVAGATGYFYSASKNSQRVVSNICANGATNYPTCNTCPVGKTLVSGSCTVTSGNNGSSCTNQASNPPMCNIYTTQTTMQCSPNTVHVNLTSTKCSVSVTSNTTPTGSVSGSCKPVLGQQKGECTTSSCGLLGISSTSSTCSFNVTATGSMPTVDVCGKYLGDMNHHNSTACFTLTVVPPPVMVTVTGSVHVPSGGTPTQVRFVSNVTHRTFRVDVNSSGSYTIDLKNMQSYDVTIVYDNFIFEHTCQAATFVVHSYSDIVQADQSC